jgi:hypothetical protein
MYDQLDRSDYGNGLGQHLAGVDEDVVAVLHRLLVARPNRFGAALQDLSADGGYRVVGVVDEGVGRFSSGWCHRQRPVAVPGVGLAVAMRVVAGEAGAGQRPVLGGPPLVGSHHEDHHRRLLLDTVGNVFDPPVEPAQLETVEVDRLSVGGGTEVTVGEHPGQVDVAPRSDNQPTVPC